MRVVLVAAIVLLVAGAPAIAADPQADAAANLETGADRFNQHDYDGAIAKLNEAIRLDPNHGFAYVARGSAWLSKGEGEKAIADFDEAIRLDPKDAKVYLLRGAAWVTKNDYDKAIADLNEAIRLDPRDASAWLGRGFARSGQKNFDDAIADYTEAIRLDPQDPSPYNSRGRVWARKKDYEKALADFDQAVQLDPKDRRGYANAARLRASCPDARFRDGKKAVQLARKACKLSHWKDGRSLEALGAAYAQTGDFRSAVKYQEQAIRLKASDAQWAGAGQQRLELYRAHKPYTETAE